MQRKAKLSAKPKPLATPVPLLSPQIWMADDFDPDSVSIPRMRAILDFNQVTDSYYRKYQQVALFRTKVLPRVKVLVDKHDGDISSIDDSILLKEIQMIPTIASRKRRASSESGDPVRSDERPDGDPVESTLIKLTNKRIKSSK